MKPQRAEEVSKITVKMHEINKSLQELAYLFQSPTNQSLAWRLKLLLKQLSPISQAFEDRRIELCKAYGILNTANNNWDIPEEKQAEFNSKFSELVNEVHEIKGKPIRLSELGKIEFSANQLLSLEWLIVG